MPMEPDYSNYTTAELLEALDSIDQDLYPHRVKQIKQQLAHLSYEFEGDLTEDEPEAATQASEEKVPGTGGQVFLSLVAVFLLWVIVNAATTGTVSVRSSDYHYASSPTMFLLILGAYTFAMGACIKRVVTARRKRLVVFAIVVVRFVVLKINLVRSWCGLFAHWHVANVFASHGFNSAGFLNC